MGLADTLGSNLQRFFPSQVPHTNPSGASPLLLPVPGHFVTLPVAGSSTPRLLDQVSVKTIFPSLRIASQCCPVCFPGVTGIGYSLTIPVRGSSFPMIGLRLLVYQIFPSASPATSCGRTSKRGSSYSVMMTRVAEPLGLGKGFMGGNSDCGPRTRARNLTSMSLF